jgi:tetratricopeptide (TPR) repeat protein
MRTGAVVTFAWGVASLAWFAALPTARAGDLEDFELARTAYESGEYQRAASVLEQLLERGVESRLLAREIHKYLGASYVYLDRRELAREQFELILREDPDYPLDPLRFPRAIIELFESVRERVSAERREAEARAELERRLRNAEERAARLLSFAEEEITVEVPNSRWIAAIPFGMGQFQNGNEGLGWFFLISQAVCVGIAVGATLWHDAIVVQIERARALGDLSGAVAEGNLFLRIAWVLDWSALGAFAALAISGVLQAQLDFVERRRVTERRRVPDELRGESPEPVSEPSRVPSAEGGSASVSSELGFFSRMPD